MHVIYAQIQKVSPGEGENPYQFPKKKLYQVKWRQFSNKTVHSFDYNLNYTPGEQMGWRNGINIL